MKRVVTEELLDEHDAPREDMERSLRDLRRFNRWAGGTRTYLRLLRRFAPNAKIVVDLGAGTADLLDALPPYVMTIGVDLNIKHLLYERNRSRAMRVVADANHLPFRDDSVDVVTSSHFFHHFEPEENASILRGALRIARIGAMASDTRRHRLPFLFVKLLGVFHLVGRITAFDAPASVARGYTAAEARAVGEMTGAARVEVVTMMPFRFGLVIRR
ncbi:MAG: class I SAM-dependent methyltransferase [Acidobacteria bacterium]|nr:class I SAM-dependent methyltransferase [Acidobacteriota bacterium]MBV9067394.1 class I SAM-dependent methyltransferase [Acidobacteriota bacterium]MBV9187495.1 class I SAM-dependent methyltransferase [Acidobacteriota bacterium]